MYPCPYCDCQAQDFQLSCPDCAASLKTFAMANEGPDRWFNEALASARNGDWLMAVMKCNAALVQRTRDAGLWMLLGTVYARMEAFGQARQCFQTVLAFDAGYAPARQALEHIARLEGEA
jgi:Flp pilus assembly protein TadD